MIINKLESNEQKNTFIALKMIEGLYKQGILDSFTYKNILNDYKNIIDIEEFLCYADSGDNKKTINNKIMEAV